jgi:HD-like signal output (HDOD) protein
VANGTKYLPTSHRRHNDDLTALTPVSQEAAGVVRMLLSQPAADLQAITDAIQSDLGLTIRLFHLAAQKPDAVPRGTLEISEIVVHLGRKNLEAIISPSTRTWN